MFKMLSNYCEAIFSNELYVIKNIPGAAIKKSKYIRGNPPVTSAAYWRQNTGTHSEIYSLI